MARVKQNSDYEFVDFQRKDIQRTTWYSNDGKSKKEINHILINTKWTAPLEKQSIQKYQVWGTDHRLVVTTTALRLSKSKFIHDAQKNMLLISHNCYRQTT